MMFFRLLLLLVATCNGFAPSSRVSSHTNGVYWVYSSYSTTPVKSRGTVALQLFGTRRRIKRVYQSIRNRLRRSRRGEEGINGVPREPLVASAEDRSNLVSALQEGDFNAFTFTLPQEDATRKIGNDIQVSLGVAEATVSALESVEGSKLTSAIHANGSVNGDIPIPSSLNGKDASSISNGELSTKRNGKVAATNGEAKHVNGVPWGANGVSMPTNGMSRPANDGSMPFNGEAMPTNGEVFANGKRASPMLQRSPRPESAMAMAVANNTMTAILTKEKPYVGTMELEQIEPLKSLYTLPPIDRNLTRLESEFRDMLEYFCQFTEADLYTIRDPRVRAIMEGVVSGSNEAPVYRAFEVLFEDLPPLRVAGRMIYSKLKNLMLRAQARAQAEVDDIVESTGLSEERVQVARLAFLTLAIPTEQEHDKEAHLTMDQLVESGLAESAMISLGYHDMQTFLDTIDPSQSGKVTFPQLMAGLQMDAEEACAVDRCDPAQVLQSVVKEMEPTFGHTAIRQLDKKRQEYSDRYDSMVAAFQEWDDIVPEGEGRRLDVLRGCFVGAANHRVVEALRVVYLDYAALRLAGNSIFAIMKTLVGQIRKRKSKR